MCHQLSTTLLKRHPLALFEAQTTPAAVCVIAFAVDHTHTYIWIYACQLLITHTYSTLRSTANLALTHHALTHTRCNCHLSVLLLCWHCCNIAPTTNTNCHLHAAVHMYPLTYRCISCMQRILKCHYPVRLLQRTQVVSWFGSYCQNSVGGLNI